ncbi:MAG: hypothetical protein DLM73_07350 [Chthoniobacterales bacterium]|nr:MAG: hypothetical protein DLM73_07350 [Chthoniobacterales bacterium]
MSLPFRAQFPLHATRCAQALIAFAFLAFAAGQTFGQAPAFSQIIVFGDSLSDDGNVKDRTENTSGGVVSYPSGNYNYANGRFTNSASTSPGSPVFVGTWHEQLAQTFLGLPAATYSLGGGTDSAFGGATTKDGTSERTVISNPTPFGGGQLTITVNNMGKQISDYLASHVVDPNALYIVWGGGNDLFDDDSAASVSATASRAAALVNRLALAGAKYILVPNVPPLGVVPNYLGNEPKMGSLNAASQAYRSQLNANLDSTVAALAVQGITPTIYRLDVWANFVRITANPFAYGFGDVQNSSQGHSVVPDNFLFWDDIHPTTSGHYQTAKDANRALTTPPVASAKALNLAARINVGLGENVAIGGFIVTGNVNKRVYIRGLGPSLSSNGVPNPLLDPTIELFDGANSSLMKNDNWRTTQEAEIMATGNPPKNNSESAIIRTLPPGRYTVVLAGNGGGTGNGLIEVYDLDAAADATLANISARGFVGTNDNVLIGGFIIGSGDEAIVVVRAIGPSLAPAGIANPLLDPTIELHNGNGDAIGFNDDWKGTQASSAIRATQLMPTDDREAAIVASLPPGNYTAVVRGKSNATGVALVEAYRIP